MSRPRISVVIPTCHRNDLLALCLEALSPQRQTIDESYEVIVTDDSSHNSAEALIRAKFPWAKWTQGPCRGPAANRNHGASLAQGEWLALTDDDCIPEPDWLRAFAEAIRPGRRVYEGRTTTDLPMKGPRWQTPVNEHGGYLWSCNILIKRQLFEQLGGFDEAFPYPHMEDVDLRLRIVDCGEQWDFVQTATVCHPQRPATTWLKRARAQKSSIYICHKHGLPLSFACLTPLAQLRILKRVLTGPGPLTDKLGYACGMAAELAYLIPMIPYWKFHYKKQ